MGQLDKQLVDKRTLRAQTCFLPKISEGAGLPGLASIGLVVSGQQAQKCCLPGAVRTHKPHPLTTAYDERDFVEHIEATVRF